jgi:hypothetical protein
MSTPLNPQEIYLLERYTSVEYFGEMRDAWGAMIKHVEDCLDKFMHNLPLDYRNRALPEQPDAVWGEHVLPNFRATFQGLCKGYIELSHGDLSSLAYAHGPGSDFKGQMDFWAEWMGEHDVEIYRKLMGIATEKAGNIGFTDGAYWNAGTLSIRYNSKSRGALNPPPNWPSYRLVPSVKVATDARVTQNGIYLPDIDNSCAQFLSMEYDVAPEASVFIGMKDLFLPDTGLKYGESAIHEKRPCIWTLVERVADQGGISSNPSLLAAKSHRVPAGQACPESGFYFTPAKADSRRHFTQGELLPGFDANYGMTIWQWDTRQD